MYLDEFFSNHKTHMILAESCQGLTKSQRRIVEGIYQEFTPLIEVSLAPQQINQIFTNVEQGATAAGGNRTLAGRGVDAARAVDDTINKVGRWLQNTAPVQAFDQKFDNLKTTIGQKFPEVSNSVGKLGEWAKANPGKTAAVIGVLTTIAALGAGPVGGAIAGQILRGSAELLKGEKLSTAVGKGAKTAAYGALAGAAIGKISDFIGAQARVVADNIFPGQQTARLTFSVQGTGPGTFQQLTAVGRPDDVTNVRDAFKEAAAAWKDQNYEQALAGFRQAASMADKLADPAYVASMTADKDLARTVLAQAKNLSSAIDGAAAAAQGAIQTQGMNKAKAPTESRAWSLPIDRLPLAESVDRNATLIRWSRQIGYDGYPSSVMLQPRAVTHLFRTVEGYQRTLDALLEYTYPKNTPQPAASGTAQGGTSQPGRPTFTGVPARSSAAPAAQPAPAKPGLFSRMASGIGNMAKQFTTKITAEKLNKSWKEQGAPTDSEEVSQLLLRLGVPLQVVTDIYGQMGLPAPSGRETPEPAAAQPGVDATQPAATSAEPAAAEPAAAEPAAAEPAAAEPAAAEPPAKPSANEFAQQLTAMWQQFVTADGSAGAPAVKRALRDMWMQAGGVKAESRNPKVKESLRAGEYHVAKVTLDDGTVKRVRITSDEGFRDQITQHFARQGHQVKDIKVDYAVRMDEKQDACYRKVKSRYKVWPSAYASGALVQCRKKGAANWGTEE